MKEATEGHETELKKIIEGGDVDVEFTKPDKNTVVHICAAYGYVDCLKLFLATVRKIKHERSERGWEEEKRNVVIVLTTFIFRQANSLAD